MNLREFTFGVLLSVEQQHIFVNNYLKDNKEFEILSQIDQSLAYNIIYGVIQNKLLLDYQIDQFLRNPNKLNIKARLILRMVAYQSIFLDTIPSHAICFEAVDLAKKNKLGKLAGLVNAVSRKLVKINENTLYLPAKENSEEYLSIRYSHPKWLVRRWIRQRGVVNTEATLAINNKILPTTIRINPSKITLEKVKKELIELGFLISEALLTPEIAINIDKGNVFKTDFFEKGFITIQDQGAIKACYMLGLRKKQRILDMCSAPGGKTALIANLLDNDCKLVAMDINKERLKLVEEICTRMEAKAEIILADSSLVTKETIGTFDRILLDAPCTGLGTLRSKPEIRWYRIEEDVLSMVDKQRNLLTNGLKLLKPNGILAYVTCSNETEETENLVNSVENIEIIDYIQLYPNQFNTEGFYIAVVKKRRG